MEEDDICTWRHFWDWKSDDWLDGYCFAEGTVWYCADDTRFAVHHYNGEIVCTFDLLQEEEE